MSQSWNPGQNNAANTLTNNNLTATNNSGTSSSSACYALISKTVGKFYWETTVTFSGSSSGNVGVGIGNTATSVANGFYIGDATNSLGHFNTGELDNNNSVVATYASWTSGTIICHALDLDNGRYWVRPGVAANWNNNAANNPATNTGGFAIPAGVTASPVLPGLSTLNNTAPDSVVAAFAATSWAGTAPAGFISFDGAPPWGWEQAGSFVFPPSPRAVGGSPT